jgi:hypothetical protein
MRKTRKKDVGEKRNWERSLGRSKCRWEDIKMSFRELVCVRMRSGFS